MDGVLKHKYNTKIHEKKQKKKESNCIVQRKNPDLNPNASVLLSNQYLSIDRMNTSAIPLPPSFSKKGRGENKTKLTIF